MYIITYYYYLIQLNINIFTFTYYYKYIYIASYQEDNNIDIDSFYTNHISV